MDEAQIKRWAGQGWNQRDVAQALGLTYSKFRSLLRMHPEFKWPRGQTIAQRRYQAEKHPKGSTEQAALMRAAQRAKLPKYTVRGVTGTLHELAHHFKVVSFNTSHRRVRLGFSVEQALLAPGYLRRG